MDNSKKLEMVRMSNLQENGYVNKDMSSSAPVIHRAQSMFMLIFTMALFFSKKQIEKSLTIGFINRSMAT